MNFKHILFASTLSVGVFACGSESAEESSDKNEEQAVVSLTSDPIQNIIASENPDLVYRINVMNLLTKSQVLENSNLPPVVTMIGGPGILNMMSPEVCGLKLNDDVTVCLDMDDQAEPERLFIAVPVADKELALSYLQKQGGVKFNDENGVATASIMGQADVVISDHVCLMSVPEPRIKMSKEELMDLANSAGKETQATEQIVSFINDDADFAMRMDVEFMKDIKTPDKDAQKAIDQLISYFPNGAIQGALNFEDGQARLTYDLSSVNQDKFSELIGSPVDESYSKYLTQDKLLGAMMFSYQPENLLNLMVEMNDDFDAAEFQEKTGMTIQEVAQIFDGKVVMAFQDMIIEESGMSEAAEIADEWADEEFDQMTEEEVLEMFEEELGNIDGGRNEPKFCLIAGLNNAEDAQARIAAIEKMITKDGYFQADKMFITIQDNKLIASLDEENIKYLSQGNTYKPFDIPNMGTSPFMGVGFLNPKDWPSGVLSAAMAESDWADLSQIMSMFDKVTFNADMNAAELKLTTTVPNENILKTLTDNLMEMSKSFM